MRQQKRIIFVLIWINGFLKIYEKLIRKSVKDMLKDGDNSSMIYQNTMIIEGNDIKAAHIIPRRYLTEETKKELLDKLASVKENK